VDSSTVATRITVVASTALIYYSTASHRNKPIWLRKGITHLHNCGK